MSETESTYTKPLPAMVGLTAEFYGHVKNGELRFQRCSACKEWRHVPREMCPSCGSAEWSWEASSGKGTVFSWIVAVRAMHPAFQEDAPYAPVVVEMEEGVRLLSTVVDCAPDELEMDMPVTVVFDAVTDEITLPRFKRANS